MVRRTGQIGGCSLGGARPDGCAVRRKQRDHHPRRPRDAAQALREHLLQQRLDDAAVAAIDNNTVHDLASGLRACDAAAYDVAHPGNTDYSCCDDQPTSCRQPAQAASGGPWRVASVDRDRPRRSTVSPVAN